MVQIKDCSASTERPNWECKYVYDSDVLDRGWETLDADTSPWIKLNLNEEYELQQLKIKTIGGIKKFSKILIEFSDNRFYAEALDSSYDWNIITLPRIRSQYIKITRESSHGSSSEEGGISRIKASGCPSGKVIYHKTIMEIVYMRNKNVIGHWKYFILQAITDQILQILPCIHPFTQELHLHLLPRRN